MSDLPWICWECGEDDPCGRCPDDCIAALHELDATEADE